MANTAQSRKRARQNVKRRQLKASQRSMVRTYIKNVVKAIDQKDYAAATEAYKRAVPVIDRIADKGVIHKNKAARHKSRLNKAIKALAPQFQHAEQA
ncbi:30S ribosomal protein S20 [Moraxella atlantae]|uniref:Small ribosomal subunit protein bS20 n=1 Tax=Faucicola atlantae TaxID=34059 RepID=A0A1B8Q8B8_9GAMM|nr:30S ribosomal protein S20 [Moraxella atlantae]OBX72934.1 30S ribosomal protein S20 [Moraxella atlantae]